MMTSAVGVKLLASSIVTVSQSKTAETADVFTKDSKQVDRMEQYFLANPDTTKLIDLMEQGCIEGIRNKLQGLKSFAKGTETDYTKWEHWPMTTLFAKLRLLESQHAGTLSATDKLTDKLSEKTLSGKDLEIPTINKYAEKVHTITKGYQRLPKVSYPDQHTGMSAQIHSRLSRPTGWI